jgi:ubiquinone/menaquinone biosynthesis C-methylase UbiE
MMKTAFDHITINYDMDFTFSGTGSLQRKRVMEYVEKHILTGKKLNILELNCGTGEDALHFYRKGHSVHATDSSSEMLKIARSKSRETDPDLLKFTRLSFREIPRDLAPGTFDLVFSNFGGLNCINLAEFRYLLSSAAAVLKPGGRFVGVIMPRFCVWEILYFAYKLRWKEAFRRNTQGFVTVYMDGYPIRTWYHSPRQIRGIAGDFRIIAMKPIGIALPPSYLDLYFRTHKRFLRMLDHLERFAGKLKSLAGVSDHFLVDMELKGKHPDRDE